MISHVVREVNVCPCFTGEAIVSSRVYRRLICVSPVTERRAVAFGDLLHLVVVSQHKERLLEFAHLLHFGHHVLVDSIHDLLHTHTHTHIRRENSQLTLVCGMINNVS